VSPERPDQDDFLEDEEQEEYGGQRSIFATGWFRAVLVLLVLAVIAVIAVPLIGGWFEPTPPPKVATKPSEPSSAAAPAPSVPVPSVLAPPTAPATPAPSQMPSPGGPAAVSPPVAAPVPTPAPSPALPPPVVSSPAPTPAPARPEMPAATAPKAAEKAPERTAAVAPAKSAPRPAASDGNYWVQVGAFKESSNAEGLARKLRAEGFSVLVTRVVRDEPLHVVRVGGYPDRARAAAAREALQGKGQTGFVTSGPAK
jgi:cell division protein FtsN